MGGGLGGDVVLVGHGGLYRTMLPLVARVRESVDCHVAALPVPYRTHEAEPSFQALTDLDCDCIPAHAQVLNPSSRIGSLQP